MKQVISPIEYGRIIQRIPIVYFVISSNKQAGCNDHKSIGDQIWLKYSLWDVNLPNETPFLYI